MRRIFSVLLPLAGLALFAIVSYRSALLNHRAQPEQNKYLWWSSLRLDTDPQNEHPSPVPPCKDKDAKCAQEKFPETKIAPDWPDKILVFTAFPAFLTGFGAVMALSLAGIDEVFSFMIVMPILIFGWFYFIGLLLDAWIARLSARKPAQLRIT